MIAFSASFFNCPAVAVLLNKCDEIYSTNDYAVSTFPHRCINRVSYEEISEKMKSCTDGFITFSDLLMVFHNWVQTEATDAELEKWYGYFNEYSAHGCRTRSQKSFNLSRHQPELLFLKKITEESKS